MEASRARAEREAERQRRAVPPPAARCWPASRLLLALAVVAGVVAISQRGEARDAAQAADAQRLGAQALTDDRLDHALLLARTGVALDETPATLGSLLSVLQRSPAELGGVPGRGLAAVPGVGQPRPAAPGARRRARRRHGLRPAQPPDREPLRAAHDGLVQGLRFSPDSRTLAVAGYEGGRTSRPSGRPDRSRHRPAAPADRAAGRPGKLGPASSSTRCSRRTAAICSSSSSRVLAERPASILRRFDGRTGSGAASPAAPGPAGRDPTSPPRPTGASCSSTSPGDGRSYEIDADRLRVTGQWPVGGGVGRGQPGRAHLRARLRRRRGPAPRSALRRCAAAAAGSSARACRTSCSRRTGPRSRAAMRTAP